MTPPYNENFNIKKNNKICNFESIVSFCNNLIEDLLESLKPSSCKYEIKNSCSEQEVSEYSRCIQALESLKHILEYAHSVDQDNLKDPICSNYDTKHEFLKDSQCVKPDVPKSLNDPIYETKDCSLTHEFVEDLPSVPQDAQESLINQICYGETNEFLSNPLCIPPDPIESLEGINFWTLDSSISVDTLFSTDSKTQQTQRRENNNLVRLEKYETKTEPLYEVLNVEINHPRKTRSKRQRNNTCARVRSSNYKKNKDVLENWIDAKKRKRRCSHCDVKETPQWRAGPLGRNTLCNACGIRYKKGKLTPEYRPAASPTFDVIKHSNLRKNVLKFRAYHGI